MASLVFETGVPSHPTISIDNINLAAGRVDFRWIGAAHQGDCTEEFVISLAEHGELTVQQLTELFIEHMVDQVLGGESE